MNKNISMTSADETERKSLSPSEYKIGRTTYIVHTRFNLECKETLEDVLKRLMLREVGRQVA